MPTGLEELVIFIAIFFLAAFIHGSIGVGFPMIATPLLALFTDIETAILLSLIPTILVNIVSIKTEGSILYVLQRFLPLALFAMFGSFIGTEILIKTHTEIFKVLLALAIIAYLFAENKKIGIPWIVNHSRLAMLVFGLTAGLLGGLTNVMAPILIIYAFESGRSRGELIQAINLCFLLGKLVQLITFAAHDKIMLDELVLSLGMLIVVALSLYMAVQFGKKIQPLIHKKILKALLLFLAVMLCFQAAI